MSEPSSLTVVAGTYLAALDEVDAHRAAHVEWLGEQIAAGRVVAAGRTSPPGGSVVLLRDAAPESVLELFHDDPYVVAGVARYEVVATFTPRALAPELAALLGG